MSEFECFILVVFLINCVLNVFVMAYFRMVIKEEKNLDEMMKNLHEMLENSCEYYDGVSKCWSEYLKIIKEEKEKDGLE